MPHNNNNKAQDTLPKRTRLPSFLERVSQPGHQKSGIEFLAIREGLWTGLKINGASFRCRMNGLSLFFFCEAFQKEFLFDAGCGVGLAEQLAI